jgi:hypothetical protein
VNEVKTCLAALAAAVMHDDGTRVPFQDLTAAPAPFLEIILWFGFGGVNLAISQAPTGCASSQQNQDRRLLA